MQKVVIVALLLITVANAGFSLSWQDNFDNLDNWNLVTEKGADTGNNEWEYYTPRSENI